MHKKNAIYWFCVVKKSAGNPYFNISPVFFGLVSLTSTFKMNAERSVEIEKPSDPVESTSKGKRNGAGSKQRRSDRFREKKNKEADDAI